MPELCVYYVYILFDWLGIPRYVGKGKGDRWNGHEKTSDPANWLKNEFIEQTWIMLEEIPKIILNIRGQRIGLSEAEAFELERLLVKTIGRADQGKGPLVNLTDGGDGSSGHRATPATRQAIRESKLKLWEKATLEERQQNLLRLLAGLTPEKRFKNGQRWSSKMTLEQRQENGRKTMALLTPEERSERARKGALAQSPEQRRANGIRLSQIQTTEQLQENGRKGFAAVPIEVRRANAKKMNDFLTPEMRKEFGRKGAAALTLEQKRENARIALASQTLEQRQENAKRMRESMTPEQLRENARKAHEAQTPEQRSERQRKANAALTPEERSDRARRAWVTRRNKIKKTPE